MLIDALNRRHIHVEVDGEVLRIRRPTLADTIAAIDWNESNGEASLRAWLVWCHVERADGTPAFESVAQVLNAPWEVIRPLCEAVEALYSEGSK